VTYLATIFKKLKLESRENVGWGRIHLPQEDMHTTAYWLALDDDLAAQFGRGELETALWGMSHLMRNIAPLFLMCDPRDIHSVPQVRSPFTNAPTLFLYDNIPGGVGFAERLYDVHEDLIAAAYELAARCPCVTGCPSCVGAQIGDDSVNGVEALPYRARGKSSALKLLLRLGASWQSSTPGMARPA
jgi:DEAD/DEAH box helicase domain-containing protein